MEKNQGKVIVGLFFATIFSAISQAAFADAGLNQQVLNKVDGNYGANLNSISGATVSTNGNYADITNTQTNSVLNWNTLNTAPGQTLNFNMTAGQTSLNRVLTPQLSRFAGNLTSTGGRVIISNPMGMIFENGSYTNVNALTLTTHDAQFVGGNLVLNSANLDTTKGIVIGGVGASSNAAVMRVADDLNIVSNSVKVENADIFAKNVDFVTTDGITYVEKNLTITDSNNSNALALKDSENNEIGTVHVKDSIIALKDNTDGRIYIASKGDKAGVKIENSVVDGNAQLNVDGNVDMSVIGNADIVDSNVLGNLNVETVDDTITLASSGKFYDTTYYVYTLDDYLTRKFNTPAYTKANTQKYLKALAKSQNPAVASLSSDIVDYYHENAATTVCGVLRVSYDYLTNTSYTGNGDVSISNTTAGGMLNAVGANVNLTDVTVYDYTANAVGTTGAIATVNDKVYRSNELQRYSFGGTFDSSNNMTSGNFDNPEPLAKTTTLLVDRSGTVVKAPASNPGTVTTNNVRVTRPADADTLAYGNDQDKDLYGIEVNARFVRQFTPRGFAASDDEINARKAQVKSTAKSGNNNSIILNDKFIAD